MFYHCKTIIYFLDQQGPETAITGVIAAVRIQRFTFLWFVLHLIINHIYEETVLHDLSDIDEGEKTTTLEASVNGGQRLKTEKTIRYWSLLPAIITNVT